MSQENQYSYSSMRVLILLGHTVCSLYFVLILFFLFTFIIWWKKGKILNFFIKFRIFNKKSTFFYAHAFSCLSQFWNFEKWWKSLENTSFQIISGLYNSSRIESWKNFLEILEISFQIYRKIIYLNPGPKNLRMGKQLKIIEEIIVTYSFWS